MHSLALPELQLSSASVIFGIGDLGYLLFRYPSAILPDTEREDLLIWSVNEYFPSLGKFFVISDTSIPASKDNLNTFNQCSAARNFLHIYY